jgi:hypothetical protein
MATTEHTINDALADLLRETRCTWRDTQVVKSENTGMIKDSAVRPDILILEPNVSPVVIETEVLPAVTVEQDAIERLGNQIKRTGRPILSSVAVRLPERLRTFQGEDLKEAIWLAYDLEMALYTGENPDYCVRWPASGWLQGNLGDLSILVQSASVPPAVIDTAADQLVDGVNEAAGLLGEMAQAHPGAMQKIGQELRQEDDPQTRRMAATILANAFVFHGSLLLRFQAEVVDLIWGADPDVDGNSGWSLACHSGSSMADGFFSALRAFVSRATDWARMAHNSSTSGVIGSGITFLDCVVSVAIRCICPYKTKRPIAECSN